MKVLLCWERSEVDSWTPDLATALREAGDEVCVAHDLDGVLELDLSEFDVCLPRFRARAADMASLDEYLSRKGIPMVNSAKTRRVCEQKALAHIAFELKGIAQPRSFVVSEEGAWDRRLFWDGETVLKPLNGNRSAGIEILPSLDSALTRARARREDLLVQELIWPARCWRIVVGRRTGIVDPYWRKPPRPEDRILAISTGSTIVREEPPGEVRSMALQMLAAVEGDLLAVDLLEGEHGTYALEINHNFDAHGGTEPAVEAFRLEMEAQAAEGADRLPSLS